MPCKSNVTTKNPSALHIGTMDNRAIMYPMLPKNADFRPETAEESQKALLLSGCQWSFRYDSCPEDVPESFIREDCCEESLGYAPIPVPGCWQNYGYDRHQYTNTRYPSPLRSSLCARRKSLRFLSPVVELTEEEAASESFLNFEGVDSCFYVWVNGSFVGYSQGLPFHQ